MNLPLAADSGETHSSQQPWVLPSCALTLYYGCPEMPRLSHYFLPRVLLAEKRILYLDGANQISPLLIAALHGSGVLNRLLSIASSEFPVLLPVSN